MEKQQAIDLNDQYLTLFPREKKTPTTPDYGGTINRGADEWGKNQIIGNVILYVKKNKQGETYFTGYFYLELEKFKLFVTVKSQQYDNPEKPAMVGTIQAGEDGRIYNLVLWHKVYKNGKFYRGKISLP
jgi:hypothetical protein